MSIGLSAPISVSVSAQWISCTALTRRKKERYTSTKYFISAGMKKLIITGLLVGFLSVRFVQYTFFNNCVIGLKKLEVFGRHLFSEDDHSNWAILEYNDRNFSLCRTRATNEENF